MSSPNKKNATKYSSNNLPNYIQNACDWANMRGWKIIVFFIIMDFTRKIQLKIQLSKVTLLLDLG